MAVLDGKKSFAEFAESRGLELAETTALPTQGYTLGQESGRVEGCATGLLPGGIEGTLAHFVYTDSSTDSDGNTTYTDRRFTLVVTAVPESIGFVPYLGFSGRDSRLSAAAGGAKMVPIELDKYEALKGARASAYAGTQQTWLAQLFSPALVEWLTRSDADFGFELCEGVLCVGRNEHLAEPRLLEALCTDAARLAGALREESLEEAGTGNVEAARDPDAVDPHEEAALREVAVATPADVATARLQFASHLRGSGRTYLLALRSGLIWTLVINVPAIAIPLALIHGGLFLPLALGELVLIALIALGSFRRRVRAGAAQYADEAFFRAYAAERGLALEEPLHFLATHVEAKLPFKPQRVLSGRLPGDRDGSLALIGDGSKRTDRIAVVAGPRGPVAEAELRAEPPGISATTLDGYCVRLGAELPPAPG